MIGTMRERLVLLVADAPVISVTSLTRSGTTATATTSTPHGFASSDYVTIAAATPGGYNGKVKVAVTGTTTFTFTVGSGLATPATGTITATYASDAQGGRRTSWRTLDTVAAEMMPLSANERLQLAAIQSDTKYRFRVRVRPDLTPAMRMLWTPSAPAGAPRKTLEVTGVPLAGDGRTYQFIDAAEAAA